MVKHSMPTKLSTSSKFDHFTESSWKLLRVRLKMKWEPIAKVSPVGEIWWCPLELKTFQKWKKKFGGGSERIPVTYAIVTAKALVLSAILNRWLPRSKFIYSNNILVTAGYCKSELRYLKHWYGFFCLGLEEPILEHSFGRSSIWGFSILREHLFF